MKLNRLYRFVLTGSIAAMIGSYALAASPAVTITGAWIRFVPAGRPAGGFFTLHNDGTKPVTLTGATSPACATIELHKTETMGGMGDMEHMEAVTKIDVAPGGTLVFAPGGYHLMCMNPTSAIKPGASVSVTLEFAGGGEAAAAFDVK